jgi:hypothetical protein
MNNKSADSKAEQLRSLFCLQRGLPSHWHCKYVATDDAAKDQAFTRALVASMQPSLAATPAVGDDLWHSHRRISKLISNSPVLQPTRTRLAELYEMPGRRDVTVDRFKTALIQWCTDIANVPEMHAAVHTAQVQAAKAELLFAWQAFAFLSRNGTNANEWWHRHLEKVCSHTGTVRPDHMSPLLCWHAYSLNVSANECASKLHWHVNVANLLERRLFAAVFQPLTYLPFAENVHANKYFMSCQQMC